MFADPIRYWRRTRPDKIAVVDRAGGARYSYRELDARIDRMTAALRNLNVGRGDRVGVLASNRIEQIDLFYACHRVGAALVPLNWRLARRELTEVLMAADVRVLFATQDKAAGLDMPFLDLDAELEPADAVVEDARNHSDDPALILFTSGSTGKPKGAILPHRQILFNAIATTMAWELSGDDSAAVTTPFFHTGGWNVFATPLWQRGGTVVLLDKFEPNEFMLAMAEERCTVALTVPTQLRMLMECRSWGLELPHLRSFFSGGAPCPQAVLEQVRTAGYAVREGYGLTECGPNCFTIEPDQALARPGVVGWPVPFLEVRTVDGELRDVGAGEVGELLLRGPQMFAGYWNDALHTNEAVTPEGWLRTGDLALRHDDGAYSIVGRRKEMYISGGENVYPAEIEAVLSTCPGVVEVAVIGVPDEQWGEVGRAYVVASNDARLLESVVIDFARARLAKYKTPKSVVFVEMLPRLGSGKIDRRALVSWP